MKAFIYLVVILVLGFLAYQKFYAEPFFTKPSPTGLKAERSKLLSHIQKLREKRRHLEANNAADPGQTALGSPAKAPLWRREAIAKIQMEIAEVERKISSLDGAIQKEKVEPH